LIAEAGELFAGVGELAAFEESAGAAGSALAKTAAGAIISSHIEQMVDSALGKGTYKKAAAEIGTNIDEASSYIQDFEFGYVWGTTAQAKGQRAKEQQRLQLSEKHANEFNARLAQLYLEEHRPENQQHCDCKKEQQDNEVESRHIDPQGSLFIPVEHDIDDTNLVQTGHAKTNVPVVVDASAVTDSKSDPISLRPTLELIGTEDYGSRAAEFIVGLIQHSIEKPTVSIAEFLAKNPKLLQVGKHYLEWAKTVSATNVAPDQVTKVYNGKNIARDKVFKDQQGHFSIVDETGTTEVYTGRAAPRSASKAQLIGLGFVPTLHGVWVGPKSRNNDYPIDLLDTISMMHDIEYNNHGWFYELGDVKYISRLSQNLDRMTWSEAAMARFCISWFSTVGKALAKASGSLRDPTVENKSQVSIDDFFEYLKGATGYQSKPLEGQIMIIDPHAATDDSGRALFYSGLQKRASDLFYEAAPSFGSSGASIGTTSALRSIPVMYLN
jgi:hypothetical protein